MSGSEKSVGQAADGDHASRGVARAAAVSERLGEAACPITPAAHC